MGSICCCFKPPVQRRSSHQNQDLEQPSVLIQQTVPKSRNASNVYMCDEIMLKILEYLPIQDKVEMESFSEQYDRCLTTVRLKRKVLSYEYLDTAVVSDISQYIESCANEDGQKQRLIKVFETFPNVKQLIYFDKMFYDLKLKREWGFQLIIRYYPLLESICFNFRGISDTTLIRFTETIGPSLKKLEIVAKIDDPYDPNQNLWHLFERTTALKCLTLYRENPEILFKEYNTEMGAVIKNLSHLSINKRVIFCSELSTIIDSNPKLAKLKVRLISDNSIESSSVIKKFSQLKRLRYLDFAFIGEETEYTKELADTFESLAINLKRLNHFYLKVEDWIGFLQLDTNYLLSRFKHFSNLKTLHIKLDVVSENCQKLNFEWLKTCHQLIDLKLFSQVSTFTGSISQIPLYSPKLCILWLSTKSQANITDNDLKCLAQLKHLTQLRLSSGSTDNTTVTDTGIIGLIDGCPDLQFLEVHQKVSITSHTIRKMADKAIRNPKKIFHFNFRATDVYKNKGISFNRIFDGINKHPVYSSNKVKIDPQLKKSIDIKNLHISGINFQ